MSSTLARRQEQELFGRVLDAWAAHDSDRQPPTNHLTTLLEAFNTKPRLIVDLFKEGADVNLATRRVWRVGPSIQKGSPGLFPVATAGVEEKGGLVSGWIRAALISQDKSTPQLVWGWRFDSAESSTDGTAVVRPHPHAQPITGWWMKGPRCLLHPHPDGDACPGCPWDKPVLESPPLNETHPAFPLRSATLPGLAAAFVVTLHGSIAARAIIESDSKLQKAPGLVKDDFRHVLGD